MANSYYVHGVNGPVITVRGGRGLSMMDMVRVGDLGLVGEVVGIDPMGATVQIYEDSGGIAPGDAVYPALAPMSIRLGPGLLGNIFDGIARPLAVMERVSGPFIERGLALSPLDADRRFQVEILVGEGDVITPGMFLAECDETSAIRHRVMAPLWAEGVVLRTVPSGEYGAMEEILQIRLENGEIRGLSLSQESPIRRSRPFSKRRPVSMPLLTGQRVIDSLFPIGKGGCAAIPGPFGAGKTMVQHQLAKWSDADIIVYLGCGERGNEMTTALEEFSELKDPKTGRPLMERTILIANTSNMPVAAREASIYTGMTIAEYYRDMGYHVALMADSTSRWAEALREISGRLEEMPAEEGFPPYLPSRLAEFYERAGLVETLSGVLGSVTVIGAVSPQGGDFSEPVTQNTKRFTRCFWALDRSLAYARHFPSINWTDSYSEYKPDLASWYDEQFGGRFVDCRQQILRLLQEETNLQEIVKLIGADVLPDNQRLIMETAKVIRVGFLQQNAYHKTDAYMPLSDQLALMELILHLYHRALDLTARSIPLSQLIASGIFERLAQAKFQVAEFGRFRREIDAAADGVLVENT